jgi:STE24 endopeptidase
VAVAGATLAPVLIDPLFADFRPLGDPGLAREIVTMGERAGLDIERIRVVDASRRTRRLNAYVTGLGATRQVVLYDNLLERAPRDELLLVVAHELGHAGERHVRKGLLWAIPGIFAGAWLLAGVAQWQAARDPSLAGPGDPAGLPLLWLAVSILLFLSSPIEGTISRRMEAEADWIALELSRDPDTFVQVTRRLARANLSPVTPPGWIVRWFYSHPPVLERIGMAEFWRENRHPPPTGP